MTKRPHPKHFLHGEEFIVARMDFAANSLPQVTPHDDYATDYGKRAAIAQAREDAREDAIECWDDYVEYMAEAYDRGVGPAWA